ncbi:MAG TPA: cyclic nucleotide-binding domain-containing protein [Candidatus Binatia bacterium]|nr:cyclic nucleotide-binding domain-containing protein [Candidatus Binatia bacterium]
MPPSDDTDASIARLLVLKAMPLFADVHPDELAAVAEHTHLHTFEAGERLFSGTEKPVSTIHLVMEGRVTEHRGGRPFRSHGPQHVLGGLDALALSETDVVAVADEYTRTVAIERTALRDILEDNFGLLSTTLQGVAAATLRLRRRLPAAGFGEPSLHDHAPDGADDLASRMAFLRRHTWLGHLRVRTLGQLAHDAVVLAPRAAHHLWAGGDTAEHAVVIVRGTVTCSIDGAVTWNVGPGTVLGLEETLALEPRWGAADAAADTALLSITRTQLIDALEDDPDAAVGLLGGLATVASTLRDRVAGGETP